MDKYQQRTAIRAQNYKLVVAWTVSVCFLIAMYMYLNNKNIKLF